MGSDLLCLLILKVGHEPMPPTVGTNVLGRKVLYLPSFFTYGECASRRDHIDIREASGGPGEPWAAWHPVRAGMEEGSQSVARGSRVLG